MYGYSDDYLKDIGNLARKAGDMLDDLVRDLYGKYEDNSPDEDDYRLEEWLDRLQEMADDLIDYGSEIYHMKWIDSEALKEDE
jgi:hypothetical protein